jgi:peptidoglycan hydrolase-like protein with peptidoglycan-binding domain
MLRFIFTLGVAFILLTRPAMAQDGQDRVWVQIEAQPSIALAEESIRAYAEKLQDVNGFALGGGWYAIALGPYTREDAGRVLQVLRRERTIPRDSYIAFSSSFRQQFWPVGANLLNLPEATEPQTPAILTQDENAAETTSDSAQTEAAPVVVAEPEPEPEPDETPAEARRSESQLSRDEKKQLQIALKWAGHYEAAIDGAYGPGTRRSMRGWQDENGYEPTGILTTRQRAELLRQYNAVLEGLDLQVVRDETAGIAMQVPLGVMRFDRYEAPFAHFKPTGDVNGRLILISQTGDQTTLFGLYDILQTLAVIPEDGPRERRKDGFTIVGENARFISYTDVSLRGGEIKGYTLVWPSGDEERRTRMLAEMQKSFERIDGVMPAAMGADSGQSIDLLSGLEIRKPILSRSGFYVNSRGAVVTTSDAVAQCGRITIDKKIEAEVLASDAEIGVALLTPKSSVAPLGHARFATQAPRLKSEIATAGYPYQGRLTAPTLSFGILEELQGLSGEDGVERLSITTLPGDAGGPVIDQTGAVIGMLQPARAEGRQLPPGVAFAVDTEKLVSVMQSAGVPAAAADGATPLVPEDITRIGMDMTVLVSCWE